MYLCFKLTLFVNILCLFNNCFASIASKPTIIYIVFNDGVAITDQNIDQLSKFFSLAFPTHEVVTAEVRVNRLGLFEKYHRERLIKKMAELVRPEHEITHLVIDTHGASKTSFFGFDAKNSSTQLGFLGSYDEMEPDLNFKSVFNSIKHQVSRKLTVVLNSCSTMCGTETQKKNRARSLLNYFHADQGQVYGAYTQESGVYLLEENLNNNSFKFRDLFPKFRFYTFAVPTLMTVGYFFASYANVFSRLTIDVALLNPVNMSLAAGGFAFLASPIVKLKGLLNILQDKKINLGAIYYFNENGEVVSEGINKRLKKLAQIYKVPNTCQFFLKETVYSSSIDF